MNTPSARFLATLPVTISLTWTPVTNGLAENFVNDSIPDKTDLRVPQGTVLEDFRGAQCIPSVYDGDMAGEFRQENGLFQGGIATSDDC